MQQASHEPTPGERLEVRTYFVRNRNALVARAEFQNLYVDHYLHLAQHGLHLTPEEDALLKQALTSVTLHGATRPWKETCAWTIHFQEPARNLFVSASNPQGAVVGTLHTENVKHTTSPLFYADVVEYPKPARRSVVEFTGTDVFSAVEHFYAQSEQRPARLFPYAEEDFVLISAQPDCDLAWLENLTLDDIHRLDQTEELSLLEKRYYQFSCGCSQEKILTMLARSAQESMADLFGEDEVIRVTCPRCAARHMITRESMEAYLAAPSSSQPS